MNRIITTLVLLFSLLASLTIAAEYGRITGKVAEAETELELAGANVTLKGTTLGAATDLDGSFVIPRVPVGTYTIQVTFLGYETLSQEVEIEKNRIARHRFTLQPTTIKGEEVVVWGARAKGQALALNQQKNAVNIKNIVATDQMGRFPDASAPEAVQRIPGISVQRDMGEGRYIQIRGGSPQMTSVTFNGERVPSPEGDDRQIALDAVPVDILDAIEVSKAITPDQDADAIGGSVNLVTKRAPDNRVFSVETAGGYAPIREKFSPNGSITYGNRVSNGKFGYLLSLSGSRRNFGADDLEPEYELNDPGKGDDQLGELQVRHYTLWRARLGGTAMLDYELADNSYFYLRGVYAEMQDDEQRMRLRHRVDKGDYNADGSVTDAEMVFQHKSRIEYLRSMNVTAGGEHLLGSGIGLDYHVTVTRSEEDTPRDNEIEFVREEVNYMPNISQSDEIRANPMGNPFTGPFEFDNIEPGSSLTRDDDVVGAFNLSVPYRLVGEAGGKLQFGIKFRNKDKTQDVTENAFELTDEANDILLEENFGESFSNDGYVPGDYPFPSTVTRQSDVDDFVDNYRSSLENEYNLEADVEDYTVKEQTLAGYVMTQLDINPLFMILPGVRMERTDVDVDGFEFDPEQEVLRGTTGGTTYTKLFPMIHTRYRLTPTTNLRAAFTTALARPNFYDMAPYRIQDDEDLEIGNPELLPATSSNFDIMIEQYDRTIGLVSLGAFYKAIEDPIFTFSFDNDLGGTTEQPRNGESGSIMGIEIALQRQLKFLPAPFDGLGIYGNYTYTDSKATLPGGREAKFSGQPDHVYNLAVSYEKRRFSGQFSVNYHDKFIVEFGSDAQDSPDSDIWIDTHLQLDLSLSYQLTNTIKVYGEAVNLTNEPLRSYIGYTDRPIQLEYYKPWSRIGIRYAL